MQVRLTASSGFELFRKFLQFVFIVIDVHYIHLNITLLAGIWAKRDSKLQIPYTVESDNKIDTAAVNHSGLNPTMTADVCEHSTLARYDYLRRYSVFE